MSNYKNGLSLCVERINNDTLMTLKITGTLTQEDYKLLTPMINFALEGVRNPKIIVMVDGKQVEGHELIAVWDCFKIGLELGSEFEKQQSIGAKHRKQFPAKRVSRNLFQST